MTDSNIENNINEEQKLVDSLEYFADDKELSQTSDDTEDGMPQQFEMPYSVMTSCGPKTRYRLVLEQHAKTKSKKTKKNELLSWCATILIAVIIALLLRTFVFVIATVEGPSMQPTLFNNERLFVTRYDYYFGEIKRGDIIICRFDNPTYNKRYVKRVIATAGETVEVKNGNVFINGVVLKEDYISEPAYSDMPLQTVPEDCVFVMGDNRNNSADSRKHYIGPINKNLVIGKVRFIIFPFDKFGSLEE